MLYHCHSTLSFLIAVLVLLADFATAAMPVHLDEMKVKHAWNSVPANWESLGNTTTGAVINLYIALKPDRESALMDALYEVSNPTHPRYGKYISKEQVTELVNPRPDTLELVCGWLIHHGIRPSSISTTHDGSWLTVTNVLVSQANQLLGASYQIYRNSKTGDRIIRTVSYALPEFLHTHIRTVAPTTYFPSARRMRHTVRKRSFGESEKGLTARLDIGMTPSALRWLYKTVSYKPKGPYGENRIGILGVDGDVPSQLDMTQFLTRYRSEAKDTNFVVEQWNGGEYDPSNPSNHSNVEIQYAAAVAYPAPLVFYSIGGDTRWDRNSDPIAGDMYLEWFLKILKDPSPPKTIIIGFGEPERNLPIGYAISICTMFGTLGARGVTILTASGMDGVGDGRCLDADGVVQFVPEFPSSCPAVTSVGGTAQFRPVVAANLSGGGYSFYFPTPEYQSGAVMEYLLKYPDIYEDLYNPVGRGYPDISAHAINYNFVNKGEMYIMDGTTCSVSAVAGIVSLVNDFRIFNNRATLGFLNPLLYSGTFKGLKDVDFGFNPGCGTEGFSADVGWDPITGLGTLNFEEMLENRQDLDRNGEVTVPAQ